ncbi:ECF transporter S component [Mycoplasmopsis alligatoris]|uniref:ECF transporter S component n=1 Tax=Mycoplasmopsis alligatoris A21JP2 TaxID=747682 RepID=D4XWE7_9BACT|nr:ECF transporter S component [Mycoplasmopsis alligatoris]EFF41141.1 conserved hypothetical protein [Mycoplasmopsis alligatoris A21JP2]
MIKKITYCAIYVALIMMMSLVPWLGYIKIGVIHISTIPFIVVVATLHMGFIGAFTAGLTFGIGSLIASIVFGEPTFIYPDLSVLPRILVGLLVYLFYKLLGKPNIYKAVVLGILCPVFNTLLVTVFLFIHHSVAPISWLTNLKAWIILIWLNFIVEVAFSAIVVGALWPAVKYFRNKELDLKEHKITW